MQSTEHKQRSESFGKLKTPHVQETISKAMNKTLLRVTVLMALCSLPATVAHVSRAHAALTDVGLIAVLDHIFDLLLAVGLAILAVSIGYTICRQLKLEFCGSVEPLSFSLFMGTGVIGIAVLLIGLMKLLHIWAVGPLVILAIIICRKTFRHILLHLQTALKTATATRESRVLSAMFCLLIGLFLLRALAPPNTPDELIYHLSVPKEFAKQGKIYPSYDNLFGDLPFLINMIYVLSQMAGSDISARVFSLFLAVVTALALYAFCNRFLTRRIAVISLFAFFGAGMVVEVGVTARVDVSLAGMLFLTTFAMINYLASSSRGWLWVSAFFAGFSLGIKSSAAPWLAVIGLMYLVETLFRQKRPWPNVMKNGIVCFSIAVAIASPWYIKNYVWFKNPVYPFFTGELANFGPEGNRYFNADDEQKLDAHFEVARRENPALVDQQEHEIRQAIDSRLPRHPLRFWEFFTQPDKYLVSEPFHFPNYLFLIIPLVVFLQPSRWLTWQLAMSVFFFVTATKSAWIARYLLPVYPSLTILAVYTLCELSNRLGRRFHVIKALPMWATALSLVFVVIVSMTWVSGFNALSFVSGRISRHDFLLQFPYYHRTDFINTQLPPDAKVLAIGAHMNYGIERPYLTDESWFATKWKRLLIRNDSLTKVNDDLHEQGFTHILYCPGPFTYEANLGIKGSGGMDLIAQGRTNESELARSLGPEYELLRNWSTFTQYRSKFLETVYVDQSNCEVLRIK
jgi:4-amino-4-deoxy-L-arabinose transferase-like glycosyltransferase